VFKVPDQRLEPVADPLAAKRMKIARAHFFCPLPHRHIGLVGKGLGKKFAGRIAVGNAKQALLGEKLQLDATQQNRMPHAGSDKEPVSQQQLKRLTFPLQLAVQGKKAFPDTLGGARWTFKPRPGLALWLPSLEMRYAHRIGFEGVRDYIAFVVECFTYCMVIGLFLRGVFPAR